VSKVKQGKSFEQEVEQLLRLKGYKVVHNNLVNGTQIDLQASRNDPLDNVSLVVECTDRQDPVGVDLVKEKSAVLLTLRGAKTHFRLMFVSRNGFTAESKAFADSQSDIVLLSFNDLENLLIDLTPYVNWYLHNYEHSLGIFKDTNLIANYVDLSAHDVKGTNIPSLNQFAREWLLNDKNNLLFILGDYGAGKTSFSRQFVYRLLREKYVENVHTRFTPILINLRDCRGRFDLKRLVLDSFTSIYGVEIESFSTFERFCSTGNVALVLDGFDEMNDRSDTDSIIDSFNQLYLFASLSGKVLLTCRSNFFKSNADVIELLRRFSISIPLEKQNQLIEVPLKDQEEVIYLNRLSESQIEQFVRNRFGKKSSEMLAAIRRIHDLSDLSTRPVLLDMILSTLPELENAKRKINSAALYQNYTDRWTIRDQWRVTIPLKVRSNFCEILAWSMHCANSTGIPHAFLETAMVNSLRAMAESPEQLAKFKNDIQTCSFLIRQVESDEFRFAHKSFGEFFVARKLVTDLSTGDRIQKAETSLPPEVKEGEAKNRKSKSASSRGNVDTYLDDLFTQKQISIEASLAFSKDFHYDKTSNWQYLVGALSDRIRSTNLYISMQESEMIQVWPCISSDSSVRSHLESEIRALFGKQWMPSFSEDIPISEEIATFALEHISNLGLTFDKIVASIKDEHAIDVFCDIARLSRSEDWVRANGDAIKKYIRGGQNAHIKIASAALLTQCPELVSTDFVREARKFLSPEGWSYFLFALASNEEDFSAIVASISQDETINAVDKVICLYGLGGQLPADEGHSKMTKLVVQLLRSPVEKERVLASRVCSSVSVEDRIAIFAQAFKEADTIQLKKSILSLVEESLDSMDWKKLRALWASEKDPEVQKALQQIEQLARNIDSDRKNRAAWNRVKGGNAIRDVLWKSRSGK
jgi:GTPase SAR1 family protein